MGQQAGGIRRANYQKLLTKDPNHRDTDLYANVLKMCAEKTDTKKLKFRTFNLKYRENAQELLPSFGHLNIPKLGEKTVLFSLRAIGICTQCMS